MADTDTDPAPVTIERPISTPSRGYDLDAKTEKRTLHVHGTRDVRYVMVVVKVEDPE